MAAKKNPLSDKAYEMYKQGMKLVDIAANHSRIRLLSMIRLMIIMS